MLVRGFESHPRRPSNRTGVFHVRRRLAASEPNRFSVLRVRDIRGTLEEIWRLKSLVRDAPHLAPFDPSAAALAAPIPTICLRSISLAPFHTVG
jgi:hypothetical protein